MWQAGVYLSVCSNDVCIFNQHLLEVCLKFLLQIDGGRCSSRCARAVVGSCCTPIRGKGLVAWQHFQYRQTYR